MCCGGGEFQFLIFYSSQVARASCLQLPVTMGGLILSVFISVMLMSGCDADHVREGDSPVTCSTAGVECDYNSTNLLDTVAHVYTLKECRQLCLDDVVCQFITYYDDSAVPFSHFCFLYKSCGSVSTVRAACPRTCSVLKHVDQTLSVIWTRTY